jgi:hypothetical protein
MAMLRVWVKIGPALAFQAQKRSPSYENALIAALRLGFGPRGSFA